MRKQDQTTPPKATESARRRREYWQEFLGALRLDDSGIRVPTPNTLGNLWFNLQGRDLWITVYAAASLGRIGVFLRGKPEYRGEISAKRKSIAAQIGAPVGWNGDDDDQWSVSVTMRGRPDQQRGLAAATPMVGVPAE
jgi:hypothetical protein